MRKIIVFLLSVVLLGGCTSKKETKQNPVSKTQDISLHVENQHIVDSQGKEFILKGVSSHGLAWFPQYINKKSFQTLRDEFQVNTIRLAMYTAEDGGYCVSDNKTELEKLIDQGVQYTKELGMYVIIDWHILSDNNPLKYKKEAKDFFERISQKYKNEQHILYEICNEPNGETTWNDIKTYANEIIPVIRKNTDNIIVVGTPTWSQDIDKVVQNPLKQDNIVYALHYYAATHQDELRQKYISCVDKIPIFVSEFGICDASGNGNIDEQSADEWMRLLDENKTGRVLWNLSNKNETSAIIQSSCQKTSGWKQSDLTQSGLWLLKAYTNQKVPVSQKKELKLNIQSKNSWISQNQYYQQYNISIQNTKQQQYNWTIQLTFNQQVKVDQSWNCQVKTNDNVVILTPLDYNQTIKQGQTIQDIGLIIKAKKGIKLEKQKIK
jgi:aryl-phospho-beta-D-glucosidase BglC (GH1 family)